MVRKLQVEGRRSKLFAAFNLAVILSAILIADVMQNSADLLSAMGVSGLFVSDAIGLKEATTLYWTDRPDDPFGEVWRPLLGIAILYRAEVIFDGFGATFINFILLFFSSAIFFRTLQSSRLSIEHPAGVSCLVLILVLSNVYLLEILRFPNKEIPLIALTNLFIYLLIVKRQILGSLLIAIGVFFIRDGYGIILVLCILVCYANWNFPRRTNILMLAAIFFFLAVFSMKDVAWIDHSFMRNIDAQSHIAEQADASIKPERSFHNKLINNAFSLAVHTKFFDEDDNFYLLSIGFWQLGIFIISALIWSAYKLNSTNDFYRDVATATFIVILGISFSEYIQPRYMMPLIFWLSFAVARCSHCRMAAVLISFSGMLFFAFPMFNKGLSAILENSF